MYCGVPIAAPVAGVANTGTDPAFNVAVKDTLPAGFTTRRAEPDPDWLLGEGFRVHGLLSVTHKNPMA